MERNPMKIIRSKRKTIALQIANDSTLVIRVPQKASKADIEDVVNRYQNWIEKTRKRIIRLQKENIPRKFVEGERFLYLGLEFKLHFIDQPIPLRFGENSFYLGNNYQVNARECFAFWYKDRAMELFSNRVQFYTAHDGLKYNNVRISNAKKRWGSCSPKGNLNFNWRLIMAPPEAIDYVVVHELTHLEVRSHSRRFWNKVAERYPEYMKWRKWLHDNGHYLDVDIQRDVSL
jgi:predicted metal-dependent hydrolase